MERMTEITGNLNLAYCALVPEIFWENAEKYNYFHFAYSEENLIYGAAVVKCIGAEAEILWFYIDKEYRENGRGFQFMSQLLIWLTDRGIQNCRTSYIRSIQSSYANLLEQNSFLSFRGVIQYFHFPLSHLSKGTLLEKETGTGIVSLSKCSNTKLKFLSNLLSESENGFIRLPIDKNNYLEDCSFIAMENDEPVGILLFTQTNRTELCLAYAYSRSNNPKVLINLLRSAFKEMRLRYSAETMISITALNETVAGLINKIAEVEGESETIAVRDLRDIQREIRFTSRSIDEFTQFWN